MLSRPGGLGPIAHPVGRATRRQFLVQAFYPGQGDVSGFKDGKSGILAPYEAPPSRTSCRPFFCILPTLTGEPAIPILRALICGIR